MTLSFSSGLAYPVSLNTAPQTTPLMPPCPFLKLWQMGICSGMANGGERLEGRGSVHHPLRPILPSFRHRRPAICPLVQLFVQAPSLRRDERCRSAHAAERRVRTHIQPHLPPPPSTRQTSVCRNPIAVHCGKMRRTFVDPCAAGKIMRG